MRLTWSQHLQAARGLEFAAVARPGEALALMGVAVLILAEDLLEQDCRDASSVSPVDGAGVPFTQGSVPGS